MNRLPVKDRARILHLLIEGNSLRATARIMGVSRNTVDKLLRDVGAACQKYQDETLRNLPCKRIHCDEIWSFVYPKPKNLPKAKVAPEDAGDAWTWVAIDADTKLIPCWMVGPRNSITAHEFIGDLADRLANRVQRTTDGPRAHLQSVEDHFGAGIDYAMIQKLYGPAQGVGNERRYSPAVCKGIVRGTVEGDPDQAHVSTSYVERQNRTMRMSMRRFTRLTNRFSKKIEIHVHAISLHYMYYNFGRTHKSLRVTPAMEAGVSKHVWTLEEIASLVPEPVVGKRGPTRKNSN